MEDQGITLFRVFISFAAGVLSFLSPCVLPLVPGYISLISGVSIDNLKDGVSSRRAVILNSLAFNAGLSVIFLLLGTTAGLVGSALTTNPWVRIIGGLVIIAFGLQLIGLLKITALYKDTRFFSDDKPRGILGSAAPAGRRALVRFSAASSVWRQQAAAGGVDSCCRHFILPDSPFRFFLQASASTSFLVFTKTSASTCTK
jgi:cytochrome c biogenesis protein CcdA